MKIRYMICLILIIQIGIFVSCANNIVVENKSQTGINKDTNIATDVKRTADSQTIVAQYLDYDLKTKSENATFIIDSDKKYVTWGIDIATAKLLGFDAPFYLYVTGGSNNLITLKENINSKDITYDELMKFIYDDFSDYLSPSDTFICADYAEMLHNNAEKNGIRCGYVIAYLRRDNEIVSHSFNSFYVKELNGNKRIIYISCTPINGIFGDKEINISESGKYNEILLYSFRKFKGIDLNMIGYSVVAKNIIW